MKRMKRLQPLGPAQLDYGVGKVSYLNLPRAEIGCCQHGYHYTIYCLSVNQDKVTLSKGGKFCFGTDS